MFFIEMSIGLMFIFGLATILLGTTIGIILLGDIIFKTNKGRRFVRSYLEWNEDRS